MNLSTLNDLFFAAVDKTKKDNPHFTSDQAIQKTLQPFATDHGRGINYPQIGMQYSLHLIDKILKDMTSLPSGKKLQDMTS